MPASPRDSRRVVSANVRESPMPARRLDGSDNPLIADFFTKRCGTVFSLSEPAWRARDARAVQEILLRFPKADYQVQSIYARARYRVTFHLEELEECQRRYSETTRAPDAAEQRFLDLLRRTDPERGERLAVPDRGPVIVVGRPESYASYEDPSSEFRKMIDISGYPRHRFRFASNEPSEPERYRTISDQLTDSEYRHEGSDRAITDYALIFSSRLEELLHTHGRLVTLVAGTGTIGTLGATKLLMDSDELLRRCPELLGRIRWPIEVLVRVRVQFQGQAREAIWDVQIKDVEVHLPASIGYSRRTESPETILANLRKEARPIDLSGYWHPAELPLPERLIGRPAGVIAEDILPKIRDAARDLNPILILGESGAGKELAARLIFLYNALWWVTRPIGWKLTKERAERRDRQAGMLRAPERGEMDFEDVSPAASPERGPHECWGPGRRPLVRAGWPGILDPIATGRAARGRGPAPSRRRPGGPPCAAASSSGPPPPRPCCSPPGATGPATNGGCR